MASIARYDPSYPGIGKMLVAPYIRANMKLRARLVKVVFAATAPKDTGEFAASARVETYIRKDAKGQGSRVVAAVVSDDPHGISKEVGHFAPNGRFIPGDHALTKALRAAGAL